MSKPRLFMNSLNSALSQTFLIAVSYCVAISFGRPLGAAKCPTGSDRSPRHRAGPTLHGVVFDIFGWGRRHRRARPVGAPQAAVETRARGRIFTDGESVWLGTIFASQCSHILSNIRSLQWAKSYDLFLKQSWNGPASFARPASS